MSVDDLDKTVFKQPVPGGDRTVTRPRPGRSQRAQDEYADLPQSRSNVSPELSKVRNGKVGTEFHTRIGLNPLVNAASILVAVFDKTRHSMSHSDVAGLHQRLVKEIKDFEERAREQGIKPEVILSARYLICTVLDEAVLNTPWGSESAWSQRSLLTVFHGETSGGEKCFLILERMRQAPAENLDILELFYICISLGFEGKFRVAPGGRDQLYQIRDDLFATIRRYRGDYERALSSRWQGLGRSGNSLTEYLPMWVVVSVAAAVLFFGYSGFRYWLHTSATPVALELREIADNADVRSVGR